MFDLISGGPRHPFHDPTAAPVVVSVVGHAVVISLVVVLPLFFGRNVIPSVPTIMAFVADAPVTPPPPPPPPPRPQARAAARPEPSRPQPASNPALAAPVEAPSGVPLEPAVAHWADGEGGVEGGVEGGIEGGVAGGIVGGLVAAPAPPPPPPVQQPKAPVRVGGEIQAPAVVKRVEPVYPDVALMAKVGGIVILEAVVGADGAVESVRVLRSVKFLDQAAMDAVKQWRYSPLMLNGIPTPFVLTVTLNFRTVDK